MSEKKQPPPLFTVEQMPVNPLKLSDSATIVYGAISVVNFAVGNIGQPAGNLREVVHERRFVKDNQRAAVALAGALVRALAVDRHPIQRILIVEILSPGRGNGQFPGEHPRRSAAQRSSRDRTGAAVGRLGASG